MRTLQRIAIATLILSTLYMAVEGIRYAMINATVQNAARVAARYASTGLYDDSLDYTWDAVDGELIYAEGLVGCVAGDERGIPSTHKTTDGIEYNVYAGGAESLFATWYNGLDCNPADEDHIQLITDVLRLVSIANVARGALDMEPLTVNTEDDLRKFLYSLWESDTPIKLCSSRPFLFENSSGWRAGDSQRFATLTDPSGEFDCVLNEVVTDIDTADNSGLRWADAGTPGNYIDVYVVRAHHTLPGMVFPVMAVQSFIVEQFNSASAQVSIAEQPFATPPPFVVLQDADWTLPGGSDAPGMIEGVGNLTLYAPQTVNTRQSARVQLEIELNALTVPSGAHILTATPSVTNPLGTPVPSPTPRIVQYEEQGREFFGDHGATLFCPPGAFIGCDDTHNAANVMPLNSDVTRFEWLLRAEDNTGKQEMTVELWQADEVGEVKGILVSIPFSIEVVSSNPSAQASTARFGVFSIVGVFALSLSGVIVSSLWFAQGRTFSTAAAEKAAPRVFISYRRRPSWMTARAVANALEMRGADVFLDVDDINEGRFAEILEQALQDCDYFVPILAPTTLESKWVRREIQRAIELDKVIIPLSTDDFSFYAADIPEEITALSSHNAIKILPEYFEEAMDRLAGRFLKLGED